MPERLNLRTPTRADLNVLGHIAYATGFFGQSASRYFPDERLFTLLWVWPYIYGGGGGASLLAERGAKPLGYVLGASNPQAYARAFAAALAIAGLATLGGEVRQAAQSWRYPWRALRYPMPHANLRLYPAHLHINLLPAARGLGLGSRLLSLHLKRLAANGVVGVQLSTTTENKAALRLYHKFGFEILEENRSPLWMPWLGHAATHIIMGRRL